MSSKMLLQLHVILLLQSLSSTLSQYPTVRKPMQSPQLVRHDHKSVMNVQNVNPHCVPRPKSELEIAASQLISDIESGKPPMTITKVINLSLTRAATLPAVFKPSTFVTQLLATVVLPESQGQVPADVSARARFLLSKLPGHSVGSYTDPRGLLEIRRDIEAFFWNRDYVAANSSHIFLTNGLSDAFRDLIKLISNEIDGISRGILLPSPFEQGIIPLDVDCEEMCKTVYQLLERDNWIITKGILQEAFDEQSQYCLPSAIYLPSLIIPTGRFPSREEVEAVINFAWEHQLIVIAEEPEFGLNWSPASTEFVAPRKVAAELRKPVEIATLITTTGPPSPVGGTRNGAYELLHFESEVVDAWLEVVRYLKFAPNTLGQVALDAFVNTPRPGEPSFNKWDKERTAAIEHLREARELVIKKLTSIPGITPEPTLTGIVVFVKIDLPDDLIEEAGARGLAPDEHYAIELLRSKGVLVMTGSEWLINQGTQHYNFGIALNRDLKDMKAALTRIEEFQEQISTKQGRSIGI